MIIITIAMMECLLAVDSKTTNHLRAAQMIPALYSKGVVSRTKLMLSGDVEKNPGPGKGMNESLAVQWSHIESVCSC